MILSCNAVWSFQGLLLSFVKWVQSSLHSRGNFFHNWGKVLLRTLPVVPYITRFCSFWLVGTQTLPSCSWASGIVLLAPFRCSPHHQHQPQVVSSHECVAQQAAEHLRETLRRSPKLSSLWCSVLWTLATPPPQTPNSTSSTWGGKGLCQGPHLCCGLVTPYW